MAQGFLNGSKYDQNVTDAALLIARTFVEATIPEGVTVIGDYAFGGCTKLKSASLPNGITQIGKFAFYVCGVLEEIVVPDGCLTIGNSAFSGCFKLARVVLPDSITAIGSTAFNGSIITEFIFPDKVDRIDDRILLGCSKLARVVAPSACKYVEEYAFGNCPLCLIYDFSKCKEVPQLFSTLAFNNIASGAKIYVPAELYDQWIVATNWSAFAEHVVAKGRVSLSEYNEIVANLVPEYSDESQGLWIEGGEIRGRGDCTDSVIVVPEGVTGIAMEAFNYDSNLDALILPEIGMELTSYCVYESSLRVVENLERVSSFTLSSLPLEYVSFSPQTERIDGSGFFDITTPTVYDFTRLKAVPVLDMAESFSVNEGTKILVPEELYEEWISDTNWAYFEDNIFYVC